MIRQPTTSFDHVADTHPRIVALELEVSGHHPGYIFNLAKFWAESACVGQLDFVVTPKFLDRHADVVATIGEFRDSGVNVVSITDEEFRDLESTPWLKYFKGWKLFCQYAQERQADHGLLMYSDFFQLPSILGRRAPCPFSCIYFRPTFHYQRFANYLPRWSERFKAMRKSWLLRQVLRNSSLEFLFCLDPFAVEYIEGHFQTQARIVHLPDPVMIRPDSGDKADMLRSELGIEKGRRVFLLLGCLDRRKGVRQLLESLWRLSEDITRQSCFVLTGPVEKALKQDVDQLISQLRQSSPAQIVLVDRFVPDQQVQDYYHLADVVLATYQRHMGMSSALVRAAFAGKPVLSANYGLMGELVRRRRLGITTDSTTSNGIAAGIERAFRLQPQEMFDAEEAHLFALENSADNTARKLFTNLCTATNVDRDHIPSERSSSVA